MISGFAIVMSSFGLGLVVSASFHKDPNTTRKLQAIGISTILFAIYLAVATMAGLIG